MAFTQFTNLDFDQIRTSIKDYLRANSYFTDFDFEGSNFSIIIDILAYNTYVTAFNTNMAVNESYLDSATLRDNVVLLAKNIGYVPRSKTSAIANIFFFVDLNSFTIPPRTLTLKSGLVCTGSANNSSYTFSIPEDITVPVKDGIAVFDNINIYEGSYIQQQFTVDTSLISQKFVLDNPSIDTSSIRVKVTRDGRRVEYKVVDNILKINSSSKIFLIQEIEDERYQIIFGDGILGEKLKNGDIVDVSYIVTNGTNGNGVSSFSFIGSLVDNRNQNVSSGISPVSLINKSENGGDIESVESIKYYAPRIYASQYRAVTTSDYEALVSTLFPNAEAVIAYGGEEIDPPQYGKVLLSVKPKNGDTISDFTKRTLRNKLKSYSVAGIQVDFIDLQYLYVELDSAVYYSPSFTTEVDTLNTKVLSNLNTYANSVNVNRFGGRIKYSKVVKIIDDSDAAITSNITRILMRRNLPANVNNFAQYELCYGNKFYVCMDNYNIRSTGFTIAGSTDTVYFSDKKVSETRGDLILFKLVNNEPVIISSKVGTVKYDIGEIIIDTIKITSTELNDNIIEIEATPDSNDVLGLKNLYTKLDINNSNIDFIVDDISSGQNLSGTNFTVTSSYKPSTIKYTREK
jgi:hypothetical protein